MSLLSAPSAEEAAISVEYAAGLIDVDSSGDTSAAQAYALVAIAQALILVADRVDEVAVELARLHR